MADKAATTAASTAASQAAHRPRPALILSHRNKRQTNNLFSRKVSILTVVVWFQQPVPPQTVPAVARTLLVPKENQPSYPHRVVDAMR